MLVTSKDRYVPTSVNMMVLQGEDEMYYYVHRSLYDQCVILRDQYFNLLPSFYKLLGWEGEHPEVCDLFLNKAPDPIDILGPFLLLITDCSELTTMEDMCGAISSMSMSVDFRKMFKVPAQVRQSIKFSLSVREEYRIQWDRFFQETPTFEQVSYSALTTAPGSMAETSSVTTDDGEEIVFTGDDYDPDDILAQLMAADEAPPAEPEPTGNNEEEEKPKVKSGFDRIRGLR